MFNSLFSLCVWFTTPGLILEIMRVMHIYVHVLEYCTFYLSKLKLTFSKHYTVIVPNSVDSDQVRRFIGHDLGLNCLQRLSAEDTSKHRVNFKFVINDKSEVHDRVS